jgi:hypothetical protein
MTEERKSLLSIDTSHVSNYYLEVRNGMGEHFEVVLAKNPEDFTNMLRVLILPL